MSNDCDTWLSKGNSLGARSIGLTFINDEASSELDGSLSLCRKHGLDAIELRRINEIYCFSQSDQQKRALKARLDDEGLRVVCIASPVFKCSHTNVSEHLPILERAIEFADYIGAPYVRIFSFWKDEAVSIVDPRILEALQSACDIASQYSALLLLENGKRTTHRTGAELLTLYNALACPTLGLLWDPGNCIFGGADPNPIENSFPLIAHLVRHVHIKDPSVYGGGAKRYVALGSGDLNLRKQTDALVRHNYAGYISLETHWRKAKVLSDEELDEPGGADFSAGGFAATDESLAYLKRLLGYDS